MTVHEAANALQSGERIIYKGQIPCIVTGIVLKRNVGYTPFPAMRPVCIGDAYYSIEVIDKSRCLIVCRPEDLEKETEVQG